MGNNNEEPLLQTYWLPENSKDESSALIFSWVLFASILLFIVLLAATFR